MQPEAAVLRVLLLLVAGEAFARHRGLTSAA